MSEFHISQCPRCEEIQMFVEVDDPDLDGYRCPDCLVRFESLQASIEQASRQD